MTLVAQRLRTLSWACLQGSILPLCCLDGSLRTVTPVDGRDAGTRIWWYYVDEHLERARGCDEIHARCEESNRLHMILNVCYLNCTNWCSPSKNVRNLKYIRKLLCWKFCQKIKAAFKIPSPSKCCCTWQRNGTEEIVTLSFLLWQANWRRTVGRLRGLTQAWTLEYVQLTFLVRCGAATQGIRPRGEIGPVDVAGLTACGWLPRIVFRTMQETCCSWHAFRELNIVPTEGGWVELEAFEFLVVFFVRASGLVPPCGDHGVWALRLLSKWLEKDETCRVVAHYQKRGVPALF